MSADPSGMASEDVAAFTGTAAADFAPEYAAPLEDGGIVPAMHSPLRSRRRASAAALKAVVQLLVQGLVRRGAAHAEETLHLALEMIACDPLLPELVQAAQASLRVEPPVLTAAGEAFGLDLPVARRRCCEAFALAWTRCELKPGAAVHLAVVARSLSGSAARAMVRVGLRSDVPAGRAPRALARLVTAGLAFGEEAAHAAAVAGMFGQQPPLLPLSLGCPSDQFAGTARVSRWGLPPSVGLVSAYSITSSGSGQQRSRGGSFESHFGMASDFDPAAAAAAVALVSAGIAPHESPFGSAGSDAAAATAAAGAAAAVAAAGAAAVPRWTMAAGGTDNGTATADTTHGSAGDVGTASAPRHRDDACASAAGSGSPADATGVSFATTPTSEPLGRGRRLEGHLRKASDASVTSADGPATHIGGHTDTGGQRSNSSPRRVRPVQSVAAHCPA